MTLTDGTCDDRFGAVRDALEKNLETGEEVGAALVVDVDGERVVDLWGGYRDEARTVPWDEHTIVNVWSCTKTVTALAVLMLVDRAWSTSTRRWRGTGRSSGRPTSRTCWCGTCSRTRPGSPGSSSPP